MITKTAIVIALLSWANRKITLRAPPSHTLSLSIIPPKAVYLLFGKMGGHSLMNDRPNTYIEDR
jgi:hypothetical protein